jgi:hypothetical protein
VKIENSYSWQLLFGLISGIYSKKFTFPGFLNLVADIGYLSYILSFSSNFVMYYKFNKNFGEAVILFWAKKTKKNLKK